MFIPALERNRAENPGKGEQLDKEHSLGNTFPREMEFPTVGSPQTHLIPQEPGFRMGRIGGVLVKTLSNGSMPERVCPVCPVT